jgi:hypothetical protein
VGVVAVAIAGWCFVYARRRRQARSIQPTQVSVGDIVFSDEPRVQGEVIQVLDCGCLILTCGEDPVQLCCGINYRVEHRVDNGIGAARFRHQQDISRPILKFVPGRREPKRESTRPEIPTPACLGKPEGFTAHHIVSAPDLMWAFEYLWSVTQFPAKDTRDSKRHVEWQQKARDGYLALLAGLCAPAAVGDLNGPDIRFCHIESGDPPKDKWTFFVNPVWGIFHGINSDKRTDDPATAITVDNPSRMELFPPLSLARNEKRLKLYKSTLAVGFAIANLQTFLKTRPSVQLTLDDFEQLQQCETRLVSCLRGVNSLWSDEFHNPVQERTGESFWRCPNKTGVNKFCPMCRVAWQFDENDWVEGSHLKIDHTNTITEIKNGSIVRTLTI